MLTVDDVSCGIVRNASFCVLRGTCLGISGPSGSGKTTLLNAIAGNRTYSGHIVCDGINIDHLAPWKRGFRYLNQRLYLFPYLTLDANLALAQYAARKKRDKSERLKLLADFEIAHLVRSYPDKVSGGEQQRATLARALIGSPKLLLLDEPFANLDWELKIRLWQKIKDIQLSRNLTILLVSHEPREIKALADRCIYINNGIVGA
jgi:molybdate transport system ATP-binding protein